ncbi:hypothetical protein Ancab_032965 [Ancistrocladus abbreviatus]
MTHVNGGVLSPRPCPAKWAVQRDKLSEEIATQELINVNVGFWRVIHVFCAEGTVNQENHHLYLRLGSLSRADAADSAEPVATMQSY